MSWIITKPIIAIVGSRSINNLNLDQYLNFRDYAAVISGGANGVDTIAEQWAKEHKMEFICYRPVYEVYGKEAPLIRDREMVDAADILVAFWDGRSTGTKYTIDYAKSIKRKIILHLINERD